MTGIVELMRRVIAYPVIVMTEIPARSKNWFEVRVTRRHRKFTISGKIPTSKNLAVLVVFPGTTTFGSVERLSLWFEAAGYSLIIVINDNKLSELWVSKLKVDGRAVIHRPNIGSDFGAYKMALQLLLPQKNSIENLVLANDSMVYPPSSRETVEKVVDINSREVCTSLFLNKQSVIHAPSMLLKFGKNALKEDAFWNFWHGYYPYSSKRKIIRRGEHRLTKVLGWENISPVYSAARLPDNLEIASEDIIQAAFWAARTYPQIMISLEGIQESARNRFLIEFSFENFHISDSLGLFCSRTFGAPIKLDLAPRGLTTKQNILRLMSEQGISDSELSELQKILDQKKSFSTRTLFQRLFY
jgi:hypothetical protein